MHRTSRAQNPAVVIIQQFARRLLAILERHRLHFGRVQARIQHFRGGPGSVRERRRRRREQSVDLFSRWATLAERQRGYTEADSRRYYETGMDFPGNGALRWHTRMRNRGDARPSNPSYSLVHRHDTYGSESQQMVRSDAVDAYTQDDVGPWLP